MARYANIDEVLHNVPVDDMGNVDFITLEKVLMKSTADVVEVVRCKDCTDKWGYPDGILRCRRTGRNMNADDFCSYGERKE